MYRGALVPCHEVPARADHVLAELQRRHLSISSQVETDTQLKRALALRSSALAKAFSSQRYTGVSL